MESFDFNKRNNKHLKTQESNNIRAQFFIDAPDPILVINPETDEIVDANNFAHKYYGYPDFSGMKITDINILSRNEIKSEFKRAAAEGRRYYNFNHRLSNGLIKEVSVYSYESFVNGKLLIYHIVRDRLNLPMPHMLDEAIFEQVIKEKEIYKKRNRLLNIKYEEYQKKASELERSYKNIKVIAEIGRKITASLDINKTLNTIYNSINKMMDASVFGIAVYQEETGIIEYKMLIEMSERQELEQIDVKDERSLAARCVRTKKIIVMNDIPANIDIDRVGEEEEERIVRSLIFAPLILKGKIIGVVMVQSYKSHSYNQRSVNSIDALASYIAIALTNSQKTVELRQKTKQLEELSRTDALTKLYNRRYMFEKIEEERLRVDRNGSEFCIVLSDVDDFKKINDEFGHDCGDYILKSISRIMSNSIRGKDFLARWGGEEFLFLLPDTDALQAKILCERIRQKIAHKKFIYDNKRIRTTMTFGIAVYDSETGIDGTIRRSDISLYLGKKSAKNCVVIYDDNL